MSFVIFERAGVCPNLADVISLQLFAGRLRSSVALSRSVCAPAPPLVSLQCWVGGVSLLSCVLFFRFCFLLLFLLPF